MILDKNNLTYEEILNYTLNIDSYSDDVIEINIDTIFGFFAKQRRCDLGYKFNCLSILAIKDINKKYELIRKYCCLNCDDTYMYLWNLLSIVLEKVKEGEKQILIDKLLKKVRKSRINKTLDIPNNLKFGVELEYYGVLLDDIKRLYNSNLIIDVLKKVSNDKNSIKNIIKNISFEEKSEYDKWHFSKEGEDSSPEVSSPILNNNLDDLNQINAMINLFHVLGAEVNDSTALHINIGADYFAHNIESLRYLLTIWSECEEIFYKISNQENEMIRVIASCMARPIKENIQKTYIENNDYIYDALNNFDKFIYNIQVREKLDVVIGLENTILEEELKRATTYDDKYNLFKKYLSNKSSNEDSCIRYTSINFNHMTLNNDNKGRIEFRMFNNSLSTKIIMQNILLIGKLCETSLKLANNPNYKENIFNNLMKHDISEEQKVDFLLDLLFDNEYDKNIFKRRWCSVKDFKLYKEFIVGEDTFVRNEKKLIKKL